MVLMCKNAGNWTQALFTLASGGAGVAERGLTSGVPMTTTVVLEGPYGGLGNTLLPSFSSVLLVAGGSGITHALSLAHDLILRAPTGVVRARAVDLVWIVRTEEAAKPLMPTLLDLVNDAKAWEIKCLEGRKKGGAQSRPTGLRVRIYVTRCPVSSPLNLLSGCNNDDLIDITDDILVDRPRLHPEHRQTTEADREKLAYLSRNPSSSSTSSSSSSYSSFFTHPSKHNTPISSITASPLRPNIPSLLSSLADETISRHGRDMTDPSGMCVTACGPDGMVSEVRDAVRRLTRYKKWAVGGVELEEEVFGF